MEIFELLKVFTKNKITIGVAILIGAIFGILLSQFPIRYIAHGEIMVLRKTGDQEVDILNQAQQNSIYGADSVKALVENKQILAMVLRDSGVNPTGKNINKLERNVKATKQSPQVVRIIVRDSDKVFAETYWKGISSKVSDAFELNEAYGDARLSLQFIDESPTVYKEYRSPIVLALGGMFMGLAVGMFLVTVTTYSKRKN